MVGRRAAIDDARNAGQRRERCPAEPRHALSIRHRRAERQCRSRRGPEEPGAAQRTALCPLVARSRAGLRMPVAVPRGTNTAAAHRRAAGRAVDTRATRSRVATRTPATCLVAPLAWGPTPLAGPAYPIVPAGVTRSSSRVHTRAARRLRRTASREYRRGRPAPNPGSRGAWACSPCPRRAHSRPLAGAGEWPFRSARRCVQHCVQRPVRQSFRPLPARVRNCRRRGATIAPPTPNFPAKPARSLVVRPLGSHPAGGCSSAGRGPIHVTLTGRQRLPGRGVLFRRRRARRPEWASDRLQSHPHAPPRMGATAVSPAPRTGAHHRDRTGVRQRPRASPDRAPRTGRAERPSRLPRDHGGCRNAPA